MRWFACESSFLAVYVCVWCTLFFRRNLLTSLVCLARPYLQQLPPAGADALDGDGENVPMAVLAEGDKADADAAAASEAAAAAFSGDIEAGALVAGGDTDDDDDDAISDFDD